MYHLHSLPPLLIILFVLDRGRSFIRTNIDHNRCHGTKITTAKLRKTTRATQFSEGTTSPGRFKKFKIINASKIARMLRLLFNKLNPFFERKLGPDSFDSLQFLRHMSIDLLRFIPMSLN